ncbi:hypothetical protein ABS772_06305 [Methylorubrum podarium]|uniref:NACHT domain-containing protein n=1 Tax=Methylorubrum podarium TaxID=200476 RepID=A0ABV1QJF5_9HYPH
MAEAGGPTTQDGIFYQNSVAALFLAELLSLEPRPPREQVVEVRVEAPSHVDDIVVSYADGHRDWIQAKSQLRGTGEAWTDLWRAFASQHLDADVGAKDRLVVALGRHGGLADDLQAIIERTQAPTEAEWRSRLGVGLTQRLASIEAVLIEPKLVYDILRRVELRVITLGDIEATFQRLDLGTASTVPQHFLASLRDLAGGSGRVRGSFRAATLRQTIAQNFGANLLEPRDWGLAAYRMAVLELTRVELPARGVSAPVGNVFIWPRAKLLGGSPVGDFEDETPTWDAEEGEANIDLRGFPNDDLARVAVVAGPGFGKSTLLQAVAGKLVHTPIVPVEIGLGSFVQSDQSVVEYLDNRINREFSIRVDWRRLADQGLCCVLFDGLDEVPSSHRAEVIRRIGVFSARFPMVAWMLTLRDPAVLNAPLGGELIELQPFGLREISELVDKYSSFTPGLSWPAFSDTLDAYPDIARLAKIPLFLAILLSAWSAGKELPRRRADLIEKYLGLLFDPDRRKGVREPRMGALALRKIAQSIAFASLEREEIGLSERQALQQIANVTAEPADAVLAQLSGAGVLRRRVDGRLQFPYPIVQEYLAAVQLVDEYPEAITERIADVVKRPWAQVVQFALELLDDPTAHIGQMLQAPDDAFSTNLRLIGRCVVNGARVTPELRENIVVLLADLWGSAGWSIRERVGRLFVDGLARPIHHEIRRRLGWQWVTQSGGGEIVVRENDPLLTLEVVDTLLEDGLGVFMPTRDLAPALQKVASDVALRISVRTYRQGTTADELYGLTDFLEQIRLTQEDSHLLTKLAEDTNLPAFLRLGASAAMADPPNEDVLRAARVALSSADWRNPGACIKIFARAMDTIAEVGAVLADEGVSKSGKNYLLGAMSKLFADDEARRAATRAWLLREDIAPRYRDILLIFGARGGDRTSFADLLHRLDQVDCDVAVGTLLTLNRFPEIELGALARTKLAERSDPPTALPNLLQGAVSGLTSLVDEFGWYGYGLHNAPLHPDTRNWTDIIDKWISIPDLSQVNRLRLIESAIMLRPELVDELMTIVLSATDPDGSTWDEDEYGHVLRNAVDSLRRRGLKIPSQLAETFVLAKRPNLPYAGVAIIAAEATPEALERLLRLYNVKRKNREVLLEAIEVLAARLDRRIFAEDLKPN